MLKVELLGRGNASYDGRAMDGFPGQQCHRLLCYLLLNHRHPHPRERLAAVFWAAYPTATSRSYLRTCLWRLRQALRQAGAPAADYLLCTEDCVSFPDSGAYWLDIEAFEAGLDACRDLAGDQLSEKEARALEGADRLYTGDLLEGIYDDWCLYDRERLRLLHLDLLCSLLAYHEGAGTYEQGLAYAQRILARDPTREKVHRQAMRLYWLMGRPFEALAQYRCCVQILHEELGIEPTAKTTNLHEQFVQNRFDPKRLPVHRQNGLPERLSRDEAGQTVAEQLLDRLRRLELVTEQTGAELTEVRRLMELALSRQGKPR